MVKMPRVSILGLMVFVCIVAVAIASLLNPTPFWISLTFTITFGLLLFGLMGAILRSGRKKAYWVGFTVFGWGYLILSYLTAMFNFDLPEPLATRPLDHLFEFLHPEESRRTTIDVNLVKFHFNYIGHHFLALAVAICGTLASRFFDNQTNTTQ